MLCRLRLRREKTNCCTQSRGQHWRRRKIGIQHPRVLPILVSRSASGGRAHKPANLHRCLCISRQLRFGRGSSGPRGSRRIANGQLTELNRQWRKRRRTYDSSPNPYDAHSQPGYGLAPARECRPSPMPACRVRYASFSHFCMKLFFAAPTKALPSLSTALAAQASRLHF
jgi:hypothetical protein